MHAASTVENAVCMRVCNHCYFLLLGIGKRRKSEAAESEPRDDTESHERRLVLEARTESRRLSLSEVRISGDEYSSEKRSNCSCISSDRGRRSGERTGASRVYLESKLDTSSVGSLAERVGTKGASSLQSSSMRQLRLRKNGCCFMVGKSD